MFASRVLRSRAWKVETTLFGDEPELKLSSAYCSQLILFLFRDGGTYDGLICPLAKKENFPRAPDLDVLILGESTQT